MDKKSAESIAEQAMRASVVMLEIITKHEMNISTYALAVLPVAFLGMKLKLKKKEQVQRFWQEIEKLNLAADSYLNMDAGELRKTAEKGGLGS